MIEPKNFFDAMAIHGIELYAGVPDSLLANFCAYLDDVGDREKHLITANEGNAIAVAMGYHLSTGKVAAVYMQNSGLGNAVNPLTSLTDPDVYRVPLVLIIGWRGEPGIEDEPQHIKQGRITLSQLEVLGIPSWIIDAETDVNSTLDLVFKDLRHRNAPVAIVVRKDTFAKYHPQKNDDVQPKFTREDALEQVLLLCESDDLIISNTGKASREIFELRVKHGKKPSDFLTVGGMGHTSSIALGMAIGQPQRRVVCLDGDGSLIMHMGCLPVIANYQPNKFTHVLLNNGSHDSVGGQATSSNVIDFSQLAKAVGYKSYEFASDVDSLKKSWSRISNSQGPVLLEIKISKGSRSNLGRPTTTAEENKRLFMENAGV